MAVPPGALFSRGASFDGKTLVFSGRGPRTVYVACRTGRRARDACVSTPGSTNAHGGRSNPDPDNLQHELNQVQGKEQYLADIDMTHVPFNGAAPSLQAALSGTTDIASVSIAGLISHIRSGTLKALAQTGAEHWVDMPDVPTMQEAGVPNAVVETSQMFLAPAGTPPEIIKRLSEETRLILQKPDIKDKMLTGGFMVKYEGPDELHARMVREVPIWKEIVERAGLAKK